MDFVIDRIAGKQTLKVLTVADPVTSEVPVLYSDYNLRGADGAEILESSCEKHGYSGLLKYDMGDVHHIFPKQYLIDKA